MSEDLTILGHPARLVIELEGEDHDISHLLRVVSTTDELRGAAFAIDATALVNEVEIERHVHRRVKGRA